MREFGDIVCLHGILGRSCPTCTSSRKLTGTHAVVTGDLQRGVNNLLIHIDTHGSGTQELLFDLLNKLKGALGIQGRLEPEEIQTT